MLNVPRLSHQVDGWFGRTRSGGQGDRVIEELSLAFCEDVFEHQKVGSGQVAAAVDRVAQLIGNLIGSAMVYGDAGRAVTITSVVGEEHVSLSVHNFGNSIPADKQTGIFEPMVRSGDDSSSIRSVGLSLFIVRAVAKAHDGIVEVASDEKS